MENDWKIKKDWEQQPDETLLELSQRQEVMFKDYEQTVKERGRPIIIHHIDGTLRVEYEKDIISYIPIKDKFGRDTGKHTLESSIFDYIKQQAQLNNKFIPKEYDGWNRNDLWICPYCVKDGGFIMRVLYPKCPEGFIEVGGVATKCICLKVRQQDRQNYKKGGGKEQRRKDNLEDNENQ